MEKRRFKFVIPAMVVVAVGAIYMLNTSYSEVESLHKVLITISAVLFAGLIAYFLFPHDDEKSPDKRPD